MKHRQGTSGCGREGEARDEGGNPKGEEWGAAGEERRGGGRVEETKGGADSRMDGSHGEEGGIDSGHEHVRTAHP